MKLYFTEYFFSFLFFTVTVLQILTFPWPLVSNISVQMNSLQPFTGNHQPCQYTRFIVTDKTRQTGLQRQSESVLKKCSDRFHYEREQNIKFLTTNMLIELFFQFSRSFK